MFGLSGVTKMDDLISRSAALDDAHRQIWYRMNQQGMKDKIDEWLKALPAATTVRPKGEWLRHEDENGDMNGIECSSCNEWFYFGGMRPKYCPNCGADMRGNEHG